MTVNPVVLSGLAGTRGAMILACTGLSIATMGISTVFAFIFSNQLIVDVSIKSTYWGWWIATPPALLAFGVLFNCRPPSGWKTTFLCASGSCTWIVTGIGIYLHNTSQVETGLTLSACAPIATFCLFAIPFVLVSRFNNHAAKTASAISLMATSVGMLAYVGMLTVLYFDYTTGLDLYLGSLNESLAHTFIQGGLILFLLACTLSMLIVIALNTCRQQVVTTSPSC